MRGRRVNLFDRKLEQAFHRSVNALAALELEQEQAFHRSANALASPVVIVSNVSLQSAGHPQWRWRCCAMGVGR